ncbi:hypothetical protein OROHE_017963 [Orobanche hederae]
MLKAQSFYQPKEGTYMKLIVLLGRCGQPGQACQLFDEMLEEGLEPAAQLYTALLGACCRSNLIDKAFSFLEQMKALPHCQPDVYTYSILIKACVDAARFDLLESLYEEMAERWITPNTVTQNIVLSGYGKAERYEDMEKVLTRMLESETSIPEGTSFFSAVLHACSKAGGLVEVERVFKGVKGKLCGPDSAAYSIMMGAHRI